MSCCWRVSSVCRAVRTRLCEPQHTYPRHSRQDGDVQAHRVRRAERVVQGRGNERCWGAAENRAERIAQGGAAVAERWRKQFREHGWLPADVRALHDQHHAQRDPDERDGACVEQREEHRRPGDERTVAPQHQPAAADPVRPPRTHDDRDAEEDRCEQQRRQDDRQREAEYSRRV